MKKFLSMILSIAIILTMAVPAFATNNAESEVSITPLTDNSWLETSINNSTMKTAATEQNAQSFVVKQYVDGKLWHASSGVVGGENIIAVSYEDGVAVKEETIKVSDFIVRTPAYPSAVPFAESKDNLVGYITYNPVVGSTVSERLAVYCDLYHSNSEGFIINADETFTLDMITAMIMEQLLQLVPGYKESSTLAKALVNLVGGALTGEIGIPIQENVSVNAYYYRTNAYHAKTDRYTLDYEGVDRQVTTRGDYYLDWDSEGATPRTWNTVDIVAMWFWNELFAEWYPQVKSYD